MTQISSVCYNLSRLLKGFAADLFGESFLEFAIAIAVVPEKVVTETEAGAEAGEWGCCCPPLLLVFLPLLLAAINPGTTLEGGAVGALAILTEGDDRTD